MGFDDVFKPYSPKIHGDLEEYLREHDGTRADNAFFGPRYFFVMKKRGLIVPRATWVRVNQSPLPDIAYFVNSDFLLESQNQGPENMSCMGAKKGIYDPTRALKDQSWSISGLNL